MSDITQDSSLASAATAMEGLLSAEEAGTNTSEQKAKAEVSEESETVEAKPQGDEETAETEESDEAAPEDEAASEDGETEQAAAQPQTVTVTVDGKTREIPLEEAAKGYQRQEDYTRKTQALAEERKALKSEAASVQQERAQYAQLLTALSQQLEHVATQEPDQTLLDTDPIEYFRREKVWRDSREKLQAAQFEAQRVQTLQQQEQENSLRDIVKSSREKMLEAVPAWKDTKRWEQDKPKILEYGRSVGFSDEELGQAYDHRAVVLLNKARLYDELVSKKLTPVQKQAPKPLQAGSDSSTRTVSSSTRAKQRLAKTGSVKDAAAVFENFI